MQSQMNDPEEEEEEEELKQYVAPRINDREPC